MPIEPGEKACGWVGVVHLKTLSDFAGTADAAERTSSGALRIARRTAVSLAASLDEEAWDGEWYKRAFFDDGTPLGSAQNDECQIDSIAQSWAVLSGVGDPDRARQAMDSVERRLVRQDDRLLLLFSPPFDETPLDPGYIKGYPPGIRENGGQYTHAAIWSVMAFAVSLARETRASISSTCSPRFTTRVDVRALTVTRWSPTLSRQISTPRPGHVGRGGWTWYTGAAAWLYRAGLESILGFRKRGSTVRIDPCIPREWKRFEIVYRHGNTLYRIEVENPKAVCRGVSGVSLDGTPLPVEAPIRLSDDGLEHQVRVVLG